LITGAAGGIGRATVALFAEKSWRVIGVDRTHSAILSDKWTLYSSDIARPENMHAIFEQRVRSQIRSMRWSTTPRIKLPSH